MKPEDSFFYKLGSEEGSNFKEFNSKTVGFILVIILVFFLFHCTTAGMVCVNRYTNSSVPCTGFQYTAWEGELMQGDLHTRYKDHAIKRPHAPLAK